MPTTRIEGDLQVIGTISATGVVSAPVPRSSLVSDASQVVSIPLVEWRIWDNFGSLLPTGAVADDLGLVNGSFVTFVPHLRSLDLNALGAFQGYARAQVTLPHEYVAGNPLQIKAFAGMLTSVASVSAFLDFEIYRSAGYNIASADLVATAAQSINSISPTDYFFDINATSGPLEPGQTLDIRMTLYGESATASSHFAMANHIALLMTSKG